MEKNFFSSWTAKHARNVFIGGNWTVTHLKDVLVDVSYDEAMRSDLPFNSIAKLSYHIYYYIFEITKVLQGGALKAKDELSFNTPDFKNESEWNQFKETILRQVEIFSDLIAECNDADLALSFTDEKYGPYFTNLWGIIEHTHYHMGQIVIIKKVLRELSV